MFLWTFSSRSCCRDPPHGSPGIILKLVLWRNIFSGPQLFSSWVYLSGDQVLCKDGSTWVHTMEHEGDNLPYDHHYYLIRVLVWNRNTTATTLSVLRWSLEIDGIRKRSEIYSIPQDTLSFWLIFIIEEDIYLHCLPI